MYRHKACSFRTSCDLVFRHFSSKECLNGTVSHADRYDLVFTNFFTFFASVPKEWRNYMAQYHSFYYERQCN